MLRLLVCFLFFTVSLAQKTNEKETATIQIAILLDTSSSMNGLLYQTSYQIWDIINVITQLKIEGKQPKLEFALYEYGNDYIPEEDGFVRKIKGFNTDLDSISYEIFSLKTKGGYEYSGYAIMHAVNNLKWEQEDNDIKLIYIAGNERFNQGIIPFDKAIEKAVEKNIMVNTIYCGNPERARKDYWTTASKIGNGYHFNIDQNEKNKPKTTPFDEEIMALNHKLNDTYFSYNKKLNQNKQLQVYIDSLALNISQQVLVNRIIAKASSYYYNPKWDLVDFYMQDNTEISEKINLIDLNFLEIKEAELKKHVKKIFLKRKKIISQILKLSKKRNNFLIEKNILSPENEKSLGQAIIVSILEITNSKNHLNKQIQLID